MSQTAHPYPQKTNALINESSPYLLQHAYNPVNWYPYGDEAFEKARKENKLMLFSIGYSACHWCHVMERESFENQDLADIMNQHFVCVKVDREERPDIDQIYMEAVQMVAGSGGWPLNCFALPNGKPIWGGTYFRPEQWRSVLKNLSQGYSREPQKYEHAAEHLTQGIANTEILNPTADKLLTQNDLSSVFDNIVRFFDTQNGGLLGQPKFPMPGLYEALLDYAILYHQPSIIEHLELTLQKWAYSGLYDILGGGFSRYSVDKYWIVPHFEKMLYDNAQILSLYAKMHRYRPKPVYKRIIDETIAWMQADLKSDNGLFFSAYDADSEGKEGQFYVWKKEEIVSVLGSNSQGFIDYYGVTEEGNFEGQNILYAQSMKEPSEMILKQKEQLFNHRENRVKPGLDDKTITAWNALAVSGLCQSYWATQNKDYLHLAEQTGKAIVQNQLKDNYQLLRIAKKTDAIEGFLDDYSLTIKAFLDLYELLLEPEWLELAVGLSEQVQDNFFDELSGMFFYTSKHQQHIVRKKEYNDNVIPSSNAIMAENLLRLSAYTHNSEQYDQAVQMNKNMQEKLEQSPIYSYAWLNLQVHLKQDKTELVVVGKEACSAISNIQKGYYPSVTITGAKEKQEHNPLFKDRWVEGKTTFYYCVNNACRLPETNIENVLNRLQNLEN